MLYTISLKRERGKSRYVLPFFKSLMAMKRFKRGDRKPSSLYTYISSTVWHKEQSLKLASSHSSGGESASSFFTHSLTTVQWQWQPFCACVFPPSLSAEWISRELGWEPGQRLGRSRRTGQCMTNECVMHTVEPGQRPAQLIRLVNTAQVNLTTKTPLLLLYSTLLLYLERETGSCLDLAPRRREGLRGLKEGCKGWRGKWRRKRWSKRLWNVLAEMEQDGQQGDINRMWIRQCKGSRERELIISESMLKGKKRNILRVRSFNL